MLLCSWSVASCNVNTWTAGHSPAPTGTRGVDRTQGTCRDPDQFVNLILLFIDSYMILLNCHNSSYYFWHIINGKWGLRVKRSWWWCESKIHFCIQAYNRGPWCWRWWVEGSEATRHLLMSSLNVRQSLRSRKEESSQRYETESPCTSCGHHSQTFHLRIRLYY